MDEDSCLRQGRALLRTWKYRLNPLHGGGQMKGMQREERQILGSSLYKRLGWAYLHHPRGGIVSSVPSCPNFPSRRQGLIPISWLQKGGFMSAPKCLILCFQHIHHSTYLCAFLGEEPGFPPARLRLCLMLPGRYPAKKKKRWQ